MDGKAKVVRVVAAASVDAAAGQGAEEPGGGDGADGVAVIVVGEAGAVGAAVADLRGRGSRAAGFVGDLADPACREAVVSMAVELFAADEVSFSPYPGGLVEEGPRGG